jgi:hypothetical protein
MRMEFRRLVGTVIFETSWPDQDEQIDEFNEQAKEALVSFYEGTEHCFWPKKEFAANAPEEVRIINEQGIVVAKYDIHDFATDTKRSLAQHKMRKDFTKSQSDQRGKPGTRKRSGIPSFQRR